MTLTQNVVSSAVKGASPGARPSSPAGHRLASRLGLGAPLACLGGLHSQGGLCGCYRGLLPQAARDVKASGIYFVIYEVMNNFEKINVLYFYPQYCMEQAAHLHSSYRLY